MPNQNSRVFEDIAGADQDASSRLDRLESREYSLIRPYVAASLFLNGVTLTVNVVYTTASVPDTLGIPAYTKGVFATFWISALDTVSNIYFAPSGSTPNTFSQCYRWFASGADTNRNHMSQTMILPLGTDGKINILALTTTATASMTIFGYWL